MQVDAMVILFLPVMVSLGYIYLMLRIKRGWDRLSGASEAADVKVSILIAVRNEEDSITRCLSSIMQQQYDRRKIEVIVIDDASEDKTPELVEAFSLANPELTLKLIRLKGQGSGKKQAIRMGLEQAGSEVILTTDADCTHHPGWIAAMTSVLVGKKAVFVSGPVTIRPAETLFQRFQFLEFGSLVVSGAGAVGAGFPLMCNGASLAYRLSAYRSLPADAFITNTPSGDDVFLMLAMAKAFGISKISFARDARAMVYTLPAPSLPAFMLQRMRWASKSRFYRNGLLTSTAAVVLLMNLAIAALFAAAIVNREWLPAFAVLLLVKTLADAPLLISFLKYAGMARLKWWIIPAEPLVAFYTVAAGIAGQFAGIKWKGRNIRGG